MRSTVLVALLVAGATSASAHVPAPVVFHPAEAWDGIDGQWSSFMLQIGEPSQYVRVLPATTSQQIWTVEAEACAGAGDVVAVQACADSHGYLYNRTDSSTWHQLGFYGLSLQPRLGIEATGRFGFDSLRLGGPGEQVASLANASIGSLRSTDYWLGIFGLHPKPTNFTSYNSPTESHMSLLKASGQIPSLSFGYTAGAQYHYTKVYASLVLGGHDASKYLDHNISFLFAPDNEWQLTVAIQNITMSDSHDQNVPLLSAPIYSLIDSAAPQIWLPEEACKKFEDAFGLLYDNATQLYLVNDTLHSSLLLRNASVTFTIAQQLEDGPTVSILLPYSSFDHIAKAPYRGLNASTNYFPLRRAETPDQYTLGRTFLQEAYIIVDWERANFSVHQVNWQQGASSQLQTIYPVDYVPSETSSSDKAKTIGIGVGIGVLGLGLLCWLGWYLWRRRQHQTQVQDAEVAAKMAPERARASDGEEIQTNVIPKAELPADMPPTATAMESGSDGKNDEDDEAGDDSIQPASPNRTTTPLGLVPIEADSTERVVYEMMGDLPPPVAPVEAAGRQLTEKEAWVSRERTYNGIDPHSPVLSTPTSTARPRAQTRLTLSDLRPVPRIQRPVTLEDVSPLVSRSQTFDLDTMMMRMPVSPLDTPQSAPPHRRRFSYEG